MFILVYTRSVRVSVHMNLKKVAILLNYRFNLKSVFYYVAHCPPPAQ